MDNLLATCRAMLLPLAMVLVALGPQDVAAGGGKTPTTTDINFIPPFPFLGQSVIIRGTVTPNPGAGNGVVDIQQTVDFAGTTPTDCATLDHFELIDSGPVNSLGQFSTTIDTDDLGSTGFFGFRAKYKAKGSGFRKSTSDCEDLHVIQE